MAISAATLSPWEPIFTHIDEHGTNVHIHSGRLRTWILHNRDKVPMIQVPVVKEVSQKFISENAVSRDRVKMLHERYNAGGAAKAMVLEPIILGLPTDDPPHDGTFNASWLIDGHHRYVLASALKLKTIDAFIVPRFVWAPFEVIDYITYSKDLLRAFDPSLGGRRTY